MKKRRGVPKVARRFSRAEPCPVCGRGSCREEVVPVEELRARGWLEVSPGLFVPPGGPGPRSEGDSIFDLVAGLSGARRRVEERRALDEGSEA